MPAKRTRPKEIDKRYVRRNVSSKGQGDHGDQKKPKAKF